MVEQTDHIEVPDSEIRVDVYRSSGPGGQSVNTTDSAVRLTPHSDGDCGDLPERKVPDSEQGIRDARAAGKAAGAQAAGRTGRARRALGAGGNASWGNQMRSYVLHPYQMVKDLRTKYEVNIISGS